MYEIKFSNKIRINLSTQGLCTEKTLFGKKRKLIDKKRIKIVDRSLINLSKLIFPHKILSVLFFVMVSPKLFHLSTCVVKVAQEN